MEIRAKYKITPWIVTLGRNKCWLNSVKILFTRVLFYAPSKIISDLWRPLAALLVGIIMLPLMIINLAAYFIFVIIAGLLGFIRIPTDSEIERVLNK